jgi:endonuclease/exonuclease/phosphatase family metal-dependent hydrolase
MTSHLESTKHFGEERKRQLKQCFQAVNAEEQHQNVIFGGDLNLRDKEVYLSRLTFCKLCIAAMNTLKMCM